MRGFGHNEKLIGRAIAGRRAYVVLATKFAAKINPDRTGIAIDGRPEYVRAADSQLIGRRAQPVPQREGVRDAHQEGTPG